MNGHAKISPSSAHRWLNCPGSIAANADKPWEQNIHSLTGTTAHALLEVALRLHCDPNDFLGKVLEEGHLPIEEEMVDAVGYALDFTHGYIANNPKAKLSIEKPVYPGKLFGTTTSVIWGTPDIQISNYPHELVTIDYKHGVGIPVTVKDNPQIKIYHVGKRAEDGPYRKYRSVVIQPRLPKRKPVQEATMTDPELMKWAEATVAPVIPIALATDAPRVAGDWCQYCHASGRCPAQLKQTFEKAANDFGKVQRDPKSVAPAELALYLAHVPMVEEAIKSLKAVAISAVHAGVEIPGYQKDWTNARRIWSDEEEANATLTKLGLTPKERYSVELLSPAQAEKVLKSKGVIPPKKRGEPRQASPLDDVIAYTEQNPSISKA